MLKLDNKGRVCFCQKYKTSCLNTMYDDIVINMLSAEIDLLLVKFITVNNNI